MGRHLLDPDEPIDSLHLAVLPNMLGQQVVLFLFHFLYKKEAETRQAFAGSLPHIVEKPVSEGIIVEDSVDVVPHTLMPAVPNRHRDRTSFPSGGES